MRFVRYFETAECYSIWSSHVECISCLWTTCQPTYTVINSIVQVATERCRSLWHDWAVTNCLMQLFDTDSIADLKKVPTVDFSRLEKLGLTWREIIYNNLALYFQDSWLGCVKVLLYLDCFNWICMLKFPENCRLRNELLTLCTAV